MSRLILTTLLIAAAAQADECTDIGNGAFACCAEADGELGARTVLAKKTSDAFADLPTFTIFKRLGEQSVFLFKSGESYQVGWMFPKSEPPVFLIDDDHRSLPGVVRFGNLDARSIGWTVAKTTLLTFDISAAEFAAARESLAVRVENTWLQPSYMHTPDFSCAAAWKLLE